MIKIWFEGSPLSQIQGVIRAAQTTKRKLDDRSDPLQKIKRKQIKRWQQNFSEEGSIYGQWPGLKISTILDRESRGYGAGPMLQRTRRLMSWMNEQNRAGDVSSQAITWDFHASGAKDGSYAVYQSEGFWNVRAGTQVPPRVIWDLDDEDEENAAEIMEAWVDKIIETYWR